jgi:hypothetical protein
MRRPPVVSPRTRSRPRISPERAGYIARVRVEGSTRQGWLSARILWLAVAALVGLTIAAPASALHRASRPVVTSPPRELIVRFASTLDERERASLARDHGTSVARLLGRGGLAIVPVPAGTTAAVAAEALEREPGVLDATPNFRRRIAARTPNDPRFGELWGLSRISAPQAWDQTTGSPSVKVAVVDTGVAQLHPELAPNLIPGWDFVDEDPTPQDGNGHGTHVAGTIGARGDNALGVVGVNWQVSVLPLRAGDDFGFFWDDDIIEAFEYACAQGARVVNGSFSTRSGPVRRRSSSSRPGTRATTTMLRPSIHARSPPRTSSASPRRRPTTACPPGRTTAPRPSISRPREPEF